jgi:hypothetical protein
LNPISKIKLVRRIEYAWRYGALPTRTVQVATVVLLVVLGASLWHGFRLRAEAIRLQTRIAERQAGLSSSSSGASTADSTDFVHTLPEAPTAVQVMQTLQQAADKEGGSVTSLQAEDHPATETTLGRLDLVLSIKATYPAILIVLREALDRYPGATVRQFTITRTTPQSAAAPISLALQPGATATPPHTEAEAHVVLSLWRRPLGVPRTLPAPGPMQAASDGGANPGRSASHDARAATAAGAQAPGAR